MFSHSVLACGEFEVFVLTFQQLVGSQEITQWMPLISPQPFHTARPVCDTALLFPFIE